MFEDDVDYPCNTCNKADWCDCWEARFCCDLCHYYGGGSDEDCEQCNPLDI